jgi:HK97 family phage major capsid protein
MPTVAEMRAKRALLLGQATELADKPEMTAEDRSKFDELIAEADKLAGDIARREKLAIENAALSKSTGRAVSNAKTVSHAKLPLGDDEGRAFEHWIRTGDAGGIQELRASNATDMNIGTAADGQYLVPTDHYQGIIARRDETMLANQIGVQKFTGKGTTINVPVDDEADGEFIVTNEAAEFDLDAPATNRVALTKLLYSKQVKLSYQLLQDEDSNLMEFLTNFVGRGLAKTHNSLLITETLANGTASLTLDAAAAIGIGEIPELVYKQPGEYAEGSVWLMKRATEGYIRGLSSSSIFTFNPNPAGSDRGRPEIWGYPVYNTEKASAVVASAKSLIFGNFNFMGLYEDPGLTFLRDPYSLAYLGQVRLLYYFRADYGVLQAEAIHYATHPSA